MHVPEAQDSPAFARSQTAPHDPQLVSVVRSVSQPFAALPSQFPKPVLHDPSWHTLPKHVAPAFVNAHTWPQVAQFCVLEVRLTSQPSEASPLQLPKPVVHTMPHAPAEHDGVPFALEHAAPHAPQFAMLDCVFVSQPFAALASQFPKPTEHDTSWHDPVAQEALPLNVVHAWPHPPQSVRVRRLVSQPLFWLPSQSA